MNKKLLTDLINYIDLFEQAIPNADQMGMDAFITFVSSMLAEEHQSTTSSVAMSAAMEEVEIARNLSLVYRYSKGYIKKALAVSDFLQTEEEYTYLVCLLSNPSLSKSELSSLNALEKTTGAQIIRRLCQRGLITEIPDQDDKRSINVSITPLGRSELMKVFPHLRSAATELSSPLTQQQRQTLLHLLETIRSGHAKTAK